MTSRARILFVLTPQFHPNTGGVQMTTYKLARWFADRGHRVSIFSFEVQGHIQQRFAQLLVPPEAGGVKNARNLTSLESSLKSVGPDVVINQMPYEHAIGDVLARQKKYLLLGCLRNSLFSVKHNIDAYAANVLPRLAVPVFRNVIGRRVLWLLHKMRHRADLKRILSTYDKFVMFGPPNLDELSEFVPEYRTDKICLIPNSVPSVLDNAPAKENRILWLGRLEYKQKRADLILPLWEQVSSVLPDWHLDVVGDGPALADLREHAESRGLERVTFHGRQRPDYFFERASLFVMTSAYEGFPNVLAEAQSYACISVIFDSFPIASWMINHGKDGFLEEPFNVTAMRDRIVKIANDPSSKTLMMNALENAKRFEIDNVGPMWVSLFEAS